MAVYKKISDFGNVTPVSSDLYLIEKADGTYSYVTGTQLLAFFRAYADGLVAGLLDDRGSYNASTNLFPSIGGSGTAGAILKGDIWYISVAGTLGGQAVTVGDSVRALVDTPGTTPSNWSILETNIGYVPENVTNKSDSYTVSSSVTYASTKALVDGLATKGTIKGTISATSGLIPFCNGTADTITTDANFSYTTVGGLKVNNKILGKGLTTQLEPGIPMEMLGGIIVRDSGGANARSTIIYINSTEAAFTATYYGGTTYVPMSFYTSDLLRMQIKVNGNITHANNTYFGNTAIDPTAYVDINGSSTAFASTRIRAGSALPTTQLDGEINYVSGRLHHYTGVDNTIAYLSDVSGLTFNASKRLASLMSL